MVLGGGESGFGAALLATTKGYSVFLSDAKAIDSRFRQLLEQHEIPYEEGAHTESICLSAKKAIVKSPGIPRNAPLIRTLLQAGKKVIGELEFAYWHNEGSKIVAVTGSNGKSTTVSLIYHICRQAGLDCALVGNIGTSYAWQLAVAPKPLYIIEVSSFQLDDIETFRPDIAVLLNITEDHLDRYEHDFSKYVASKFRILMNQGPDCYFIYCADDPVIAETLNSTNPYSIFLPFSMKQNVNKGGYLNGDQYSMRVHEERVNMSVFDFALSGKHNMYNSMASSIAASVLSIRNEQIRNSMKSFQGLPHRNEHIGSVKGIDFYDDSKATNVNSTWFALESFQKPVILILGGQDKGNDYEILREVVMRKVKAIVCLGLDNKKILDFFRGVVPVLKETKNMATCVDTCYQLAKKGDVVLLSPACASFDIFRNYHDRGEQFREAVNAL